MADPQRLKKILSGRRPKVATGLRVFTADNFQTEVVDARCLVVFDFYADRWVPCKSMFETMREIATTYAKDPVRVGRVNVDEDSELTKELGIRAVPAVMAVYRGDVVLELVGEKSYEDLRAKIDPFVQVAREHSDAG